MHSKYNIKLAIPCYHSKLNRKLNLQTYQISLQVLFCPAAMFAVSPCTTRQCDQCFVQSRYRHLCSAIVSQIKWNHRARQPSDSYNWSVLLRPQPGFRAHNSQIITFLPVCVICFYAVFITARTPKRSSNNIDRIATCSEMYYCC